MQYDTCMDEQPTHIDIVYHRSVSACATAIERFRGSARQVFIILFIYNLPMQKTQQWQHKYGSTKIGRTTRLSILSMVTHV